MMSACVPRGISLQNYNGKFTKDRIVGSNFECCFAIHYLES